MHVHNKLVDPVLSVKNQWNKENWRSCTIQQERINLRSQSLTCCLLFVFICLHCCHQAVTDHYWEVAAHICVQNVTMKLVITCTVLRLGFKENWRDENSSDPGFLKVFKGPIQGLKLMGDKSREGPKKSFKFFRKPGGPLKQITLKMTKSGCSRGKYNKIRTKILF